MKNLKIRRKKTSFFLAFLFWLTTFLLNVGLASANTVSVNATIPDTVPPSAPILIEPVDGSVLADNTPVFKWYESTDNVALSHYVFYLDGSVLYNNIPLVDTDNSYYVLDYDELNGIYSLTPKSSLSDGSRTWKIVAVDYANLSTSSDTWNFSIDTLAPSFVLTKIGDTTVSISAGDVSSVPSSSIIIFASDATANEPILLAHGEANSSVKLTVTIPDDPTQEFTQNIDGNGNYELQLGILPRDVEIRLDFIITDGVGHISVLEGVYFKIALQYWPTSTLTPTTTSTGPTLSPSFTVRPSSTVWPSGSIKPSFTSSPTLSPTLTETPTIVPTGIIPIIPPREIIHEVSDELVEKLPESTATKIRSFFNSPFWQRLSATFALLMLLLFYFLSFLILLSKFLRDSSWSLVKKVFLLLFPPFFKAQKNLVFEYRDTLASPLVMVELLGKDGQVLDFAITDGGGNFADFALVSDEEINKSWRLRIKDDNFYFPIGDKKPSQLETWQFYQGQEIDDNYHGQPILIPTLLAAGQDRLPFLERSRVFVLYLLDYPLWFLLGSWLFALIFVLRYPNLYNGLALFFYSLLALVKFYQASRNANKLTVVAKPTSGAQFSDNLLLSFESDKLQSRSMVMPFEFSKSKVIGNSFNQVILTVFARNLAMKQGDEIVSSQEFYLSKKAEEIEVMVERFQ